jgi:hypothetical protein
MNRRFYPAEQPRSTTRPEQSVTATRWVSEPGAARKATLTSTPPVTPLPRWLVNWRPETPGYFSPLNDV